MLCPSLRYPGVEPDSGGPVGTGLVGTGLLRTGLLRSRPPLPAAQTTTIAGLPSRFDGEAKRIGRATLTDGVAERKVEDTDAVIRFVRHGPADALDHAADCSLPRAIEDTDVDQACLPCDAVERLEEGRAGGSRPVARDDAGDMGAVPAKVFGRVGVAVGEVRRLATVTTMRCPPVPIAGRCPGQQRSRPRTGQSALRERDIGTGRTDRIFVILTAGQVGGNVA